MSGVIPYAEIRHSAENIYCVSAQIIVLLIVARIRCLIMAAVLLFWQSKINATTQEPTCESAAGSKVSDLYQEE